MSRSHSFSVAVAELHGVNIAILLQNFSWWYLKNKADNHQFFKGDYWVRMKITAMHEYFPYFTERVLRHQLDKMVELKLIKKDEFNTKKNDRTKWYTLTKSSKKILGILSAENVSNIKKDSQNIPQIPTAENVAYLTAENVSQSAENVNSKYKEEDTVNRYNSIKRKLEVNNSLHESIAIKNKLKIETVKKAIDLFMKHISGLQKKYQNDGLVYAHFQNWVRTQNLQDVDIEKELDWFIRTFNKVSGREFLITDNLKQEFAQQLKVGFSGEQMKTAVQNLYSSSVRNKFHLDSAYKFATPEYLLKGDNLNKYLNVRF